jgi:type IV pilus assembly protein PilM
MSLQLFFPVPKYLTLPSVGFDISDEMIRFVELVSEHNKIRLGRFGNVPIPQGVLQNGKINDSDAFEKVLSTIQKKYDFSYIRASLPEEQVYLFTLKIPKVAPAEIRSSIEFQLEDHLPISAKEAIFDYEVLSEESDGYLLQISAVPENIVTTYALMLESAKLLPISLELEAQAIARAVVPANDKNTYMIVDAGNTRTGISFVSGGVVMFATTVDIGGSMQTEMIMKNFNVSFTEAEKMKREHGLVRSDDNKELFSVLINSVSILRDEINKHYIFWHTHKDETGRTHPRVEKIILCGGNANMIGLSDYLAMSLRAPVVSADVWSRIYDKNTDVPPMVESDSLSYATAIGLALGSYDTK